MTREEIKSGLSALATQFNPFSEESKLMLGAVEALEQEPCEDCISRQAAIDALYHVDEYNGRSIQAIRNLPPVISQPKIGRWIDDKCSICGKGIEDLIDSREWYKNEMPNYCPFCGVRVVESEG